MDGPRWLTTLITPARELSGRPSQVVVGLARTGDQVQFVMRIGEDGTTVILPPQALTELVGNIHQAITAKDGELS